MSLYVWIGNVFWWCVCGVQVGDWWYGDRTTEAFQVAETAITEVSR